MSEKKTESAIVDVPTANGEVDLPRKIMTVKEIIGMKAEFGQVYFNNVFRVSKLQKNALFTS